MMPNEQITHYLRECVDVTDEEASLFSSVFAEKVLRKKQLVIQPGFTAKYRYYVLEGALRSFIIDVNGQETTFALATDNWWITDYNSYIYQQPATLFVEVVTNSTVLLLSYNDEQRLKESNPKFERFFRIFAEEGLAAQQRRLITNLTQSAKERYDSLLKSHPQFINKFPQYIIASYLGMTTEFLSKIRNSKVRRKS